MIYLNINAKYSKSNFVMLKYLVDIGFSNVQQGILFDFAY